MFQDFLHEKATHEEAHFVTCGCAAGLIAKAKQIRDPCSNIAADFLQELLELPLTGQSVFSVAANELRSAVAALSDHGRYMSLTCRSQAGRVL